MTYSQGQRIHRKRCPHCGRLKTVGQIDHHIDRCPVRPAEGKTYQASVTPIKIKNGVPTVIVFGGQEYILRHKDGYGGGGSR